MNDEVKVLAYHEAGHAVVALALGSRCTLVELEPPHTHCLHRRNGSGEINRALTAFAGMIAELLVCGIAADVETAWRVDLQTAQQVAEELAPDDVEATLERFRARAEALVVRHWREIEVVAAALLMRKSLTNA
jgi:hypothetical protein